MTWWTWLYWSLSALLGLAALATLYLSLLHDRPRGRRRCPRCWYDMGGTPGLQCPECGRTARRERSFFRTRRRYRRAAAGAVLAALAYTAYLIPRAIASGSVWNAVPTPLLVVVLQFYDGDADQVFNRVQARLGNPKTPLSTWEKLLVARRCARLLQEPDGTMPPPASASASTTGNDPDPNAAHIFQPGDAVTVALMDFPEKGQPTEVLRLIDTRGRIDLPQIGQVEIGYLTPRQAEGAIKQSMKALVADPSVRVRLDDVNTVGLSTTPLPAFASSKHDQAMQILGFLGPQIRPAIPILTRIIDDRRSPHRAAVMDLIGQVGVSARGAVPALARALDDPGVRPHALTALARLDKAAVPALPALKKLMHSDADLGSLLVACRIFSAIAPQHDIKEILPTFTAMLASPHYDGRIAAARALESLGPAARSTIPDLLRATREPPAPIKSTGVSILATFGPEAVPAIAELLDSSDDDIARPAAYWLISFHAAAAPALPRLVRSLHRDDPQIRGYAAEALGGMGSLAGATRPELASLRFDPDPWVCALATQAIADIQSEPKPFPPSPPAASTRYTLPIR